MKGILFAGIYVKKNIMGGNIAPLVCWVKRKWTIEKVQNCGTFLIKVDDTIIMTIKCTDSIDGDLINRLYLSKQ